MTCNSVNDLPIYVIQLHNFKKIRNNLEKSNASGKTPRHFIYDGQEILWQQWVDAYNHDKTNSISTFRRLSDDHFYLNSASRMRNHLADDVLGEEMVNLMQVNVLKHDIMSDPDTTRVVHYQHTRNI